METVAQVCTVLRAVLTTGVDAAAWRTGFLRQPQASLSELACTAAQLGGAGAHYRRARRPPAARPIRGGVGAR